MARPGPFYPSVFFALILALLVPAMGFAAADRGVTIVPLQSEAPGAAKEAPIRLYQSSFALVIGIDNYTNGWPRLSNAVEDAQKVAQALERQGFAVTLKKDLNSNDLEDALEEFFVDKGLDTHARLFVWFAGHGHTLGSEGFIVPADAPRPDKKGPFKRKALSMRRFGELMRLADSKHAMAVFDSCFSGTVFTTSRAMPPPVITRATALPVRQYVSSGDADQAVSDDGRFGKLFIRALNGEERADANSDGFVTGTELGLFLSDRLGNLTQNRQTPRYGKLRDEDWDRGDFVFVVSPPSAPALASAAPAATPSKKVASIPPSSAPAPVTVAEPAVVSVLADETGARVFLDGRERGLTPLKGLSLSPGRYELRVVKAGFETFHDSLDLPPGGAATIFASLPPAGQKTSAPARAYGTLTVDTAPGNARVRVLNIKPVYQRGMELDPGKYHLEATAQGFKGKRLWVSLGAGEDKYVRMVLPRAGLQDALDYAKLNLGTFRSYFQGVMRDYESGKLARSVMINKKMILEQYEKHVAFLENAQRAAKGTADEDALPREWVYGRDSRIGWTLETVYNFGSNWDVKITRVDPGSPAARAGLLAGDEIVDVARLSAWSAWDVAYAVRAPRKNPSKLGLRIMRNEVVTKVVIPLDS